MKTMYLLIFTEHLFTLTRLDCLALHPIKMSAAPRAAHRGGGQSPPTPRGGARAPPASGAPVQRAAAATCALAVLDLGNPSCLGLVAVSLPEIPSLGNSDTRPDTSLLLRLGIASADHGSRRKGRGAARCTLSRRAAYCCPLSIAPRRSELLGEGYGTRRPPPQSSGNVNSAPLRV